LERTEPMTLKAVISTALTAIAVGSAAR
jgi:hypothetical protein